MAIRFQRKTVDNWHMEEVNLNSLNTIGKKENATTMFPSSHDMAPVNLNNSILFLEKLLSNGKKVLKR